MEVTGFAYLGCPYSRQARKLLDKLRGVYPAYAAV